MRNLSIHSVGQIIHPELETPHSKIFDLPEKIIQFGTGVLLRGLPDYFIDKANKQGIFNGRVVVVKSTSQGDTEAFSAQDGLFTHCIKGVQDGKTVVENTINASISRVLSASEEWNSVLTCAANPDIEIIISNTTEVGIRLDKNDSISAAPPATYPGKLLALLYKRFQAFNGDPAKGLVIIPTELIVDNGTKLESIVLELAHLNALDPHFMDWLENANHFCNSLVDRIVPGKLPDAERTAFQEEFGYTDELMIMSEPYSLWAIEASAPFIKEKLSFYKADKGVTISESINKFRELKLRLLNGTHTFSCGLAHIAGYTTVKEAMEADKFRLFINELMLKEIAPLLVSNDISSEETQQFAANVMDRFSNPFIEHKWLSISVQYSSKMKMRNLPLLLNYFEQHDAVPALMVLGFAAYIRFMLCRQVGDEFIGSVNGKDYVIQDDQAAWFAERSDLPINELVQAVLGNVNFWETDLTRLKGFADAVNCKLESFVTNNSWHTLKEMDTANP